jgi:WXG100 family type VII secretion target
MAQIRVTSDQLRQNSSKTSSCAGDVQNTLNTLRNQINDLATSWEGSASSSFQALYTEWQNGANSVHEALLGIAKLLNDAATAYDTAEHSISQATGH